MSGGGNQSKIERERSRRDRRGKKGERPAPKRHPWCLSTPEVLAPFNPPREVMDLEVGGRSEAVQTVVENVETVEVVAGEDSVMDSGASSHGLMEQHMLVTNTQELIVPTTEVSLS